MLRSCYVYFAIYHAMLCPSLAVSFQLLLNIFKYYLVMTDAFFIIVTSIAIYSKLFWYDLNIDCPNPPLLTLTTWCQINITLPGPLLPISVFLPIPEVFWLPLWERGLVPSVERTDAASALQMTSLRTLVSRCWIHWAEPEGALTNAIRLY